MFIGKHNRPTAVKGPETEPEVAEGETSGRCREKWSGGDYCRNYITLLNCLLKKTSYILVVNPWPLKQERPEWLEYKKEQDRQVKHVWTCTFILYSASNQ